MPPPSRSAAIEAEVHRLAPDLPRHELLSILDHARASRGLATAKPATAAWLSMVAYARHVHTDYDELLNSGYDSESARFFVLEELNTVLGGWGCIRQVNGEEPDPDADPESAA